MPAERPRLDDLPASRADLARRTLAFGETLFDPACGLAWAPAGSGLGRVHQLPQSVWLAYSFLLRDAPSDRARAERALDAVLALQYDRPGTPWHGTFAHYAESPEPPAEGAQAWVHYDPNWRQFLGTALALVLADFEPDLARTRVRAIERALRLAVAGEPPERVSPAYANIALLRVWLEVEAGARLGEASWTARGEELAREIARRFERCGAFEEYNSPTYYGVDLFALALFRARSTAPMLREIGRRLEAALLRDVARWYHAGLHNLCGPYSRSYGMDLREYTALLALDLWAALGRDAAPLPPLAAASTHAHDFLLGPLVAALGVEVPEDARDALLRFPGEHRVEQRIADAPARVATGWLHERVMIGAERADTDAFAARPQYVPASIHWRRPDGGVGWLAVRTLAAPQGEARAGSLAFDWPPSARGGDLRVSISAAGLDPGGLGRTRLALPGLALRVETDAEGPDIESAGSRATLAYRRPRPDRATRFALHVEKL